ncbi:MAG TPA: CBS domain-containing protein [Polyangiaceae bacterium]
MNMNTHYVVDMMTANPIVVGPETTVGRADLLAQGKAIHYLLVVDHYDLVGVVCGCDLYREGEATAIASCIRRAPITIDDQATAEEAVQAMRRGAVGCLPVVDWSESLRGIVTAHDLRDAGVLGAAGRPRCACCGTTHGVAPSNDAPEVGGAHFCIRCIDQGKRPTSSCDELYFTLGGGD